MKRMVFNTEKEMLQKHLLDSLDSIIDTETSDKFINKEWLSDLKSKLGHFFDVRDVVKHWP